MHFMQTFQQASQCDHVHPLLKTYALRSTWTGWNTAFLKKALEDPACLLDKSMYVHQ